MKIILTAIAAAILFTMIFTWLFRRRGGAASIAGRSASTPDAECCGAHEVCEKETLLTANAEIIYYDDEELDVYSTKEPGSYSSDEIEQFREILTTMHDSEVAGWLRSLQLRQIAPPSIVREEALMIVADLRELKTKKEE